MRRMREHAFDWIALAMVAAVPAAIFQQSATSLADQGAASGGPMQNAAFYPRIVATIMSVLVVIHALRLVTGRVRGASPLGRSEGTGRALAATVMFVAYLLILPHAGFHIATPVLSAAIFILLGVGPIGAALGGVALWLATAFVFEGLLNVVLPVGIFDIALFN